MSRYSPPTVKSDRDNGMLLDRFAEFARWINGSAFHRAVLRVSDDSASPVVDYVTVLQQIPACIVLMDYDMTLREVDAARLHPMP